MKKVFLAVVAAMMLMFANISFAHVTVGVDTNVGPVEGGDASAVIGPVDARATTGPITNTNGANSEANNVLNNKIINIDENNNKVVGINKNDNRSRANSEADSKSSAKIYNAKNWITAPLLSAFVSAPSSEVPKGWKQIICDPDYSEFTIAELKNMASGGSFFNKRGKGLKTFFTGRVETRPIFRTNREIKDETVIRIINKKPGFGEGKRSGKSEGRSDWDSPDIGIFAETVLDLVEETGSTTVLVYWDYIFERESQASSIGIGGTSSHSNGSASSISAGASSSDSATLTRTVYMFNVTSYEGVPEGNFVCGNMPRAEVPAPEFKTPEVASEPQAKGCNPSRIWARIHDLEKGVQKCTRWCLNNLELRSKLGEAYIDLYQCTGDKKYLSTAIEQFKIAERNYLKGFDIKANQAKANQLIAQDYYFWAGCINVLSGPDVADQFATEKRVEKVPQF